MLMDCNYFSTIQRPFLGSYTNPSSLSTMGIALKAANTIVTNVEITVELTDCLQVYDAVIYA